MCFTRFDLIRNFVAGTILLGVLSACGGGGAARVLPPQLGTLQPAATVAAPPADRIETLSLTRAPSALTSEYVSKILADNPLGLYELDDASTTLTDSSGHSISGRYGSSVARRVKAITNEAASAASFPGGNSYNASGFAYTSPHSTLQPTRITLEAWFRLSAPNATRKDLPIVVYGDAARGGVRYGFYLHGLGLGNQCLMYQQRNAGEAALTVHGSTRLYVGSIYHAVATSDGSHVMTYINGVAETSSAYRGSISYEAPTGDGLQIGGAQQFPQYASASFPGTIAQVAVYGSPLSQAQVISHFLAGQLVPMFSEEAATAQSFVNSIGINTHFDNPYTTYATRFADVKNLLVASGIRHVRDSMVFNNQRYLDMMKELGAAGVYGSYLTQLNLSQSQVQHFPGMVGASFEQFEAPNEQDDVRNANWLKQCRAFQQTLFGWVKNDRSLNKYPVLGPAITAKPAILELGSLGPYLDYGNIHDYLNVFNPGTGGWGGTYPPYGVYGSIPYNVNLGRIISGSKPIMATETGYGTVAGNPQTLDYRTQLRYMTRLFFEQFNAGVVRSYSYELLDQGGRNIFNNFGLIQTDLRPKPAYNGIKSLIAAIRDSEGPFRTQPLTFAVTGFVNHVAHTILQRHDGSYVIAIWLELPGWNTAGNSGGDINVATQAVRLATSTMFRSATISTMDESGNLATAPMSWNGHSAAVDVSDKVTLIHLNP